MLLVAPPALILAVAIAILWLPLPGVLPSPGGHARTLASAVAAGALGLVYVVGVACYALSALGQGRRELDGLLGARGLVARLHWMAGSQYRGQMERYQVEATYVPAHARSRALFAVRVHVSTGRRMAIAPHKPIAIGRDYPPVAGLTGPLGGLSAFANDEPWARQLLEHPAIRARLLDLLGRQDADGLKELYLEPDCLWLRARPPRGVPMARLDAWLGALVALAGLVQSCDTHPIED